MTLTNADRGLAERVGLFLTSAAAAVGLGFELRVGVADGVGLLFGAVVARAGDGLGEGKRVVLGEAAGDPRVGLGLGVALDFGLGFGEGFADGEGEGDAEADADGEREGDAEEDADGEREGDADGERAGDAEGDGAAMSLTTRPVLA